MSRWPIFLMIFALVSTSVSGQSFNKRFSPYGFEGVDYGGTAFSVEIADANSELVIYFNKGWQDTIFYSSKLGMLRLSAEGLPLDTAMFPLSLYNTYAGWSEASFKRADGSFVVGGSVRHVVDGIRRIGIFFFDQTGQPDSSFVIDMGSQTWIGRHLIETSDGNFLICGEKFGGDAFIMKIAPTQEILWSWAGGGPSVDLATSVAEDEDGNYYMGGSKQFSGSNRDFWVKSFASDGTHLWDTVWGSPYLENLAYVRIASDGDLLVAGGYAIQTGNIIVKYITKLNRQDGTPLWEHWYGPGAYDGALLSLKELPNGDLIGAGPHTIGPNYVGVLLRTTSEGDSLWMRYYYYEDSITTNGRGVFRDVEPTADGGFVAVGSALTVPGIYSQDVWVVKVDEHGCIEPGCQIITGMETQITNMRDALKVWPNPVASGGQVQVEVKLPAHLAAKELRLTITSTDGKQVHEKRLDIFSTAFNSITTTTLQLPQLTLGLYHIHLTAGSSWVSGTKVVVE